MISKIVEFNWVITYILYVLYKQKLYDFQNWLWNLLSLSFIIHIHDLSCKILLDDTLITIVKVQCRLLLNQNVYIQTIVWIEILSKITYII